jgi:hypothetical protein
MQNQAMQATPATRSIMKNASTLKYLFLALAGLSVALPGSAATICPVTPNTNTDCGYIITIGPGGSITGSPVTGANPYDGADDALIGVINNSGAVFTGSFTLTGSGNGGGLFGFDGDGICIYTSAPYCATAATGYEGPLNTFSNIMTTTVFDDTGTVHITGLADGATTYFSLESSPASINNGGGPVITPGTPEPSTILLLGGGIVALAVRRWKRA